ncbi:hypothetical protein OYC64_009189 [Pagothenia borchgrevinki]|uniref:Matrin 3-like 1.1 n=1 Tax=Pagothenia borchgrevinki TaxID=8213 RepID=A0ABD2H559_PAGBO
MEGEEEEEEEKENEDVEKEEEEEETVMETMEEEQEVKQEEVPDDVTDDTPVEVGGAPGEITQGAESEAAPEPEVSAEEEPNAEPEENQEGEPPADSFEEDFLENMDDFVTLDELQEDEEEDEEEEEDTTDNSRKGGMRVVNIVGFRRGYKFMNDLLALAKPFGKVVKHLVLDLRPEAYLQFTTEEEARAMATFYSCNVTASICGRPVRISHSTSYPTIQCGSSKVVYLGQIPKCKYSDGDVLKLAEPYGRVRKYFLNRLKRECFVEMDKAEEAERMAEDCKENPPKFNGKRLTVYVSRKYRQLKHGHQCPSRSKRESSGSSPQPSRSPEEPAAKKSKEEEEEEEKLEEEEEKQEELMEEEEEKKEEEEKEEEEEKSCEDETKAETPAEKTPDVSEPEQKSCQEVIETSTNENGDTEAPPPAEIRPITASLPLPPHDPDTPIGVEHVKMGFYCRVCFLFYSNEETAKKTHCSSRAHYDKLQKHLEKEQSRAEKKKGKKTTS